MQVSFINILANDLLESFTGAVHWPYDIMIYSIHGYIEPAPDVQVEFISTVKIKVKLLFLVSNVCRPGSVQDIYRALLLICTYL